MAKREGSGKQVLLQQTKDTTLASPATSANAAPSTALATSTQQQQQEPKAMTRAEAGALLESKINTKNPTPEDIELMRAALKAVPDIARQIGDVAWQAREKLIERFGTNVVVKEAIRTTVDQVQDDLGYKDAPPVEKLLIEQIGMCWLSMYEAQQVYTNARGSGPMSLDQAAWCEKRLTMVQSRYMRAIEMLAKVRKLSQPTLAHTLMVNVAQQQINAALGK